MQSILNHLFYVFIPIWGVDSQDPVVQTPNGKIRGRLTETTTNRPFVAFEKIPYASPPVGDLRFSPPQPPKNWEGVLNTTKLDVVCYQTISDSDMESEDCLYLNVYTANLFNKYKAPLAVMVYIHGGGFISGNTLHNVIGPEFLIDHDVIVVTLQYRLGPFGFLSTQDLTIPGNYGLKDQFLALTWIHTNIPLFGGDPQKITIFGQSAGGMSVSHHLLHKPSAGLFRGAICASGTFLSPNGYQRNAREIAFRTGVLLRESFQNKNDSEELLTLLRDVSAKKLDQASFEIFSTDFNCFRQLLDGFFYAPVVEPEHEGAFLTKKMYEELKAGRLSVVPTMVGIVSEENIGFAADLTSLQALLESFDQNISLVVESDTHVTDMVTLAALGTRMRDIYTKGENFLNNLGPSIKFLSDNINTRAIITFARLLSLFNGNVFFYQFSYDGVLGNFSVTIPGADNVNHEEELKYIFRTYDQYYDNSDLSKFPIDDQITHERIQRIWTNFVKYLNPTPAPSSFLQNITWPKVSSGGETDFFYVDISKNLEIKNHPKSPAHEEWVNIYKSLPDQEFDTY